MLVEFARRVAALGQFRVADPSVPSLSRDDEHHLRTVLRASVGEEIVVTDGAGTWSFAKVGESSLERVSDVLVDPAPPTREIYMAPLKGDRSEWAVAKCVELGVTKIVPLVSAYVTVKFTGEARDKTLRRWRRIAAESAGQCRRTYDLNIAEPQRVADVSSNVAVADLGAQGDWREIRALAIGPEGGWAPTEWAEHYRRVSLGPLVLRAETAALTGAVLMGLSSGGGEFAPDPTDG